MVTFVEIRPHPCEPSRLGGAAHGPFASTAASGGGVRLVDCTSATVRGARAGAVADRAISPVIFVHGNGDSTALWLTTLWRFASNGVSRDRLVALNLPDPLARSDDATLRLPAGEAGRAVVGLFNEERIVAHAWPAAENRVTILELNS